MARSLNKVELIGNLTRDPELRYTPSGTVVCSFSIATNRNWTTDTGEKKEEADFHRIVAWNKLAELCSQFLTKGRKVYVEGRLTTRSWTAQDGTQKQTTEVIINDMILLDSRRTGESEVVTAEEEAEETQEEPKTAAPAQTKAKSGSTGQKKAKQEEEPVQQSSEEEIAPDDIPF